RLPRSTGALWRLARPAPPPSSWPRPGGPCWRPRGPPPRSGGSSRKKPVGRPPPRGAGRARPSAATVLGRFIRKKPLGAAGGFIMLVITLTAVFANVGETPDPIATHAPPTLARPPPAHWRG